MLPFPNPQAAGGRYQFTTWNPADLSNETLSNGNLTALQTAVGSGGARGTTSRSTGKRGLTFTYVSTNAASIGIANASEPIPPVADTNCLYFTFNKIMIGGTQQGSNVASATSTSVIDILFDFAAKLIWARVDGGNWNNNVANDPAAGTGGISFATLSAGPYYPFLGTSGASLGAILNPYAGGYPAGFTPWDGQ